MENASFLSRTLQGGNEKPENAVKTDRIIKSAISVTTEMHDEGQKQQQQQPNGTETIPSILRGMASPVTEKHKHPRFKPFVRRCSELSILRGVAGPMTASGNFLQG